MSEFQQLGEHPSGTADGQQISIAHFNLLSVLGSGVYASQVLLAEKKDSKSLFAIKVYSKDLLVGKDDAKGPKTERDILVKATREQHPFIVQFHVSFQTETKLLLVLEYVNGGDLQHYLQRAKVGLEAAQ